MPATTTKPRRSSGDAAALYVGKVMHARLKPVGHRFSYRVMSLLIDLDRLEAPTGNRRCSASTGARSTASTRPITATATAHPCALYAQRCAAEHGIDLTGGRVLLLCYPRLFGYTFNPLSVYFGYRADGQLALLIYEVRNTFGEIHAYVLPVKSDEISAAGIRQQQDKLFYVSPFIEMTMRYHFRVSPPATSVKLRILETDCEGPLLAATFNGRRRALTTAALLRSFGALPLVTFKIIAAIHWEALRLWLKGARLVPRPRAAPAHAALTTTALKSTLANDGNTDYTDAAYSVAGRTPGIRDSAFGSVKVEVEVIDPRESSGKERHHLMGQFMSALISVTPDNVETVLSDLPRLVRLALWRFGSKLRRGTL